MSNLGIIDNRELNFKQKFSDFCKHTKRLNLASGYFYVSGFDLVKDDLNNIKQIRIVMGNETDSTTAEELSLGHKEKIESELIKDLNSISDEDHNKIIALQKLHEFIKEGKIEVKVYVKEKFHAKAYIFEREDKSIGDVAIVGSSNFTLSGMQRNTELNSIHKQDADLEQLKRWFEIVWKEAEPYKEELLKIIESSGPYIRNILMDKEFITPAELLKTLIYEFLYHDVSTFKEILTEFQRIGVENAREKINKFNGCIIADSVGLGKTFTGARLLEYYQKSGENILLIIPASVKENWDRELQRKDIAGQRFFDITLATNRLKVMTITELSRYDLTKKEDKKALLDIKEKFNVILIDEAHRFRNHGYFDESKNEYSGNKNYANLRWIKSMDKKYILLTATPLNNSVIDLRNIVEIFTTKITLKNNNLEIGDFEGYHKTLEAIKKLEKEKKESTLDALLNLRRELEKYAEGVIKTLEEVMILRTRSDINEKYPDLVIEGKRVSFKMAEIKPEKYSFPKTYLPIYENISDFLAGLGVPHIALVNEKSGGILSGLYKVLLFKRLESSVYSFVKSLERLESSELEFLNQIKKLGWEKVKEMRKKDFSLQAKVLERDSELMDFIEEQSSNVGEKLDAVSEEEVLSLVKKDLDSIKKFMDEFIPTIKLAKDEYSYDDPKLTRIKEIIRTNRTNKMLIFTQYVDTVSYLYHHLKSIYNLNVDCVTGSPTELGTSKDRNKKIQLFAPKANQYELTKSEQPIDIMISTDALSEGVNLQDCHLAVNYDLPWNPMRIVQRIGRIDRIGSTERATVYNIYPDEELDALLELLKKLQTKIKTITEIVGKENYILSPDEEINPRVIGEKIRDLRETDDLRVLEEAGRNPLLQHLKTINDRSQLSLELKSLIQEKQYKKEEFKEPSDFVYSIMQNEHRKGVFIMFRFIDKQKAEDPLNGKIDDLILFKDLRTGEIVEKSIKELNIHENLTSLKKSDKAVKIDLETPLREIEDYFSKKVLTEKRKSFTPTKMRIKENPSKLQVFIKNRLKNILFSKKLGDEGVTEYNKGVAKTIFRAFNERAFSSQVMEKLKSKFLSETEKNRDIQTVLTIINKQSPSEFFKRIRSFYDVLREEQEYQESLRESKDIGYRKICWGAFI